MHKPIKKLDHIAIAVHSIDRAATFYTEHLGLSVSHIEEVPTQGVRVAFIPVGDIRIELVEPLHDNTPISKFLHKRGEGLHHLCFETEQIEQLHHALQQKQLRLLQKQPQPGAHQTQIAFIHPAENAGVLTELAMYPKGDPQRTIHNASNSQIASRTASKPDTNTTVQQDPSGISPKQRKGIKTMDTPHIHTIDGSSDETSESWMALRTFFEQSYKPRHTWRIGIEY
ncbi:MAG: methylmalonyl-CoA epimerase, partial [Myxococcota bacterium]